MAERHPREEALRRVHGTGALFSTAYGNVGSTPYYALGVTAAFALAVQWHPEWRVLDNPVSRRLFAAFGAACRVRAQARVQHGRDGALAARA